MHPCYCGASQGHVMGTCTCTMLYDYDYAHAPYPYEDVYSSFTPSPSSVDCTLSLGTPSTRLTQEDRRSSVSNFCWDLLQSKHTSHNPSKSTRPSNASSHNDPLLARRCANCDTTSTPLWRNGPRGPKSLCNACGIRFKKEERRASAAAAASATSAAVPGGVMESAHAYGQHSNTWYAQSQSQKMGNEYRFMEDSDRESENGIPFLSWKLNVADRTSLIHDFTR